MLSDDTLTQLAADPCPASRAAAPPADVVTPGSVLTPTGLTALLPKVTLWAFCTTQTTQTHHNTLHTHTFSTTL